MNRTLINFITVVVLTAAGTSNVVADQRNQYDERDRARYERTERPQDGRRNVEPRQQDNNVQQQNPPVDNQRQGGDNGRRNGRMTQEEKQALRRQINEAGHDIYAPRR